MANDERRLVAVYERQNDCWRIRATGPNGGCGRLIDWSLLEFKTMTQCRRAIKACEAGVSCETWQQVEHVENFKKWQKSHADSNKRRTKKDLLLAMEERKIELELLTRNKLKKRRDTYARHKAEQKALAQTKE